MIENNIIFFYPSRIVGGAEFLFARLAYFLKKEANKNVFYIDYKDGFVRGNKSFKELNFIDYSENEVLNLSIDGILITPLSNIYRLDNFIHTSNCNLKILFWCLHPYNIVNVIPEYIKFSKYSIDKIKIILLLFFHKNYTVFKNLLTFCSSNNACYFIDRQSYILNNELFKDVKENYLQLASKMKSEYSDGKLINNEINICILGRLCLEKTTSLINVLQNLNVLKTGKKINVHIIGEGEYKSLIKEQDFQNINLIFCGTICSEKLDQYLINNIDVLFAMGTSLFEGAALKIPVVPIPFSYTHFSENLFFYMFELRDYNIGLSITEHKKIANKTIQDIINDVYEKNQKKLLGNKCYDFFMLNHSFNSLGNALINSINKDSLSFESYVNFKKSLPALKYKSKLFNLIRLFL